MNGGRPEDERVDDDTENAQNGGDAPGMSVGCFVMCFGRMPHGDVSVDLQAQQIPAIN